MLNFEKMTLKPIILFKYGGNAMTDQKLKRQVLINICAIKEKGCHVVIVHGGGPFIEKILKEAHVESEFIDGLRKTTSEAMEYVEMALKGRVNGNLVSMINAMGYKAVGLSGKDGQTVIAKKHIHLREENGEVQQVDLGQVGDVDKVNPALIHLLLENDFIPVLTCLASDQNGLDYNINGDMFAGHLAGALKADQYIILTDVDGLLIDKDDPASILRIKPISGLIKLKNEHIIQGGMIPKAESCEVALKNGAGLARIINGTKPEQIPSIFEDQTVGTIIRK